MSTLQKVCTCKSDDKFSTHSKEVEEIACCMIKISSKEYIVN